MNVCSAVAAKIADNPSCIVPNKDENTDSDATNNILHIDMNDSVARNDIKTRTTAVVWL